MALVVCLLFVFSPGLALEAFHVPGDAVFGNYKLTTSLLKLFFTSFLDENWRAGYSITFSSLFHATINQIPLLPALFAGLHEPSSRGPEYHFSASDGASNSTAGGGPSLCGQASWRGIQQAASAEWALKAINEQTEEEYRIGLTVLDTCGDSAVAQRLVTQLLEEDGPPLMGEWGWVMLVEVGNGLQWVCLLEGRGIDFNRGPVLWC